MSAVDLIACRCIGFLFSIFLLNFVFLCQLLLLHPLVSAFDGKPGDAATFFQRFSESVKVKKYTEALDDLKAAIDADPSLSAAYWHQASILRQLCRKFLADVDMRSRRKASKNFWS